MSEINQWFCGKEHRPLRYPSWNHIIVDLVDGTVRAAYGAQGDTFVIAGRGLSDWGSVVRWRYLEFDEL